MPTSRSTTNLEELSRTEHESRAHKRCAKVQTLWANSNMWEHQNAHLIWPNVVLAMCLSLASLPQAFSQVKADAWNVHVLKKTCDCSLRLQPCILAPACSYSPRTSSEQHLTHKNTNNLKQAIPGTLGTSILIFKSMCMQFPQLRGAKFSNPENSDNN